MRAQISRLQLALLLANYSLSAALITFPQVIIDVALQNAWLVFFLVIPFVALLIMSGLSGRWNRSHWNVLSPEVTNHGWGAKVFAFVLLLFLTLVILKDLRSFTSLLQVGFLQETPLTIVTILIVLVLAYLAYLGLEVIARFNMLYFPALTFEFLFFIPLSLVDKMEVLNFQPILNFKTYPSLFQAFFNALPWAGEVVILFLLIGQVQPLKGAGRAAFWGTTFGLFLLYINIFTEISVMGAAFLSNQFFPEYAVAREISMTDVFDRLDLLLVVVWMPTMFSKMSLTLYGIHRTMNVLLGTNSRVLAFPLALAIGLLSLYVFQDNISYFKFYMTYRGIIGLVLELSIVALFMVLVRIEKKKKGTA